MMILRQVFLAAVAILAIAASTSADTLIVRAESNQQGGTVTLFDYLENGMTIWVLDALGASPVLYGGFSRSFGGFSAELVPGFVFYREEGLLSLKDIVLDTNVFFDHRRFSFSVINELGGIQRQVPFSLFLDHEAVATFSKWRVGLRHVSFFAPSMNSFKLGPVLGRQYGQVTFIILPCKNIL